MWKVRIQNSWADGATGVKALEESGPEAENLEPPEGGYVVEN